MKEVSDTDSIKIQELNMPSFRSDELECPRTVENNDSRRTRKTEETNDKKYARNLLLLKLV